MGMSLSMSIPSASAAKNLMPNLCRSMNALGCRFSQLRLSDARLYLQPRSLLAHALMATVGRLDEQLGFLHQVAGRVGGKHAVLVRMPVQQIQRELAAGVLARIRGLEQLSVIEARLELEDDPLGIVGQIPQLCAH